ncbi:MAG: hypothetical protein JST16_06655 [Bdellovibrionales bacterium]|nr:hypothetical protein [Bdellovibrionales bacterium]
MKTLGWMTFVLTLTLALLNLSHSSFDQPARNLSSTEAARVQIISESAAAVKPQAVEDIRNISKVLSAKPAPASMPTAR